MATPKRRAAWSPVRLLPVIALALATCSAPAPSVVGAAPPGQGVRLRVFASLTDNLLRGTSEPEQLVEIVLDRSGTPGLARVEVLPPPGSYGWEVRLLDVGGHEVVPRTGDIISVRQGDRNATFVVPPLTARFDRAGDVVFGDTDPDLLVAGEVGGARGKTGFNAPADGNGRWRAALGPAFDLRGGQAITLTVTAPGEHTLTLARRVPMVRAALSPGDITGFAAPLQRVAVDLYDANDAHLGTAAAIADAAGHYHVWVRDPLGRVVRPMTGMRLAVDDGLDQLDLPIGTLTGYWSLPDNRLLGSANPNAELQLTVWNPWFPGEEEAARTQATYRGFWSVYPAVALHPGSHFDVVALAAEGDELLVRRQIPLLSVQPGSPVVDVETDWEVTVNLALLREGAVAATASGGEPWWDGVRLLLSDPEGTPVAAEAGDTVQATLDNWVFEVPVTRFSATLGPASGAVTGTAPPGTPVFLGEGQPVVGPAVADDAGNWSLPAGNRLQDGGPGARCAV